MNDVEENIEKNKICICFTMQRQIKNMQENKTYTQEEKQMQEDRQKYAEKGTGNKLQEKKRGSDRGRGGT